VREDISARARGVSSSRTPATPLPVDQVLSAQSRVLVTRSVAASRDLFQTLTQSQDVSLSVQEILTVNKATSAVTSIVWRSRTHATPHPVDLELHVPSTSMGTQYAVVTLDWYQSQTRSPAADQSVCGTPTVRGVTFARARGVSRSRTPVTQVPADPTLNAQ